MVLQTLLTKIKERNFRGIAKQTERLDTQTRQHLQEFLQVVPAEQEELEDLQEELYDASVRLHDLQEKEEFIGVRLQSYQSQLKQIAKGNSSSTGAGTSNADDYDDNDTNPPPVTTTSEAEVSEDDESPAANNADADADASHDFEAATTTPATNHTMGAAKQDEHRQALAKIQTIHNTMKQNIKILEKKIAKMEKRKLELQFHLEECQVVLKTSKQMEQLETELAAEQAVEQLTIAVDNGEVGQIEIVDLQANKKKAKDDKAAHETTTATTATTTTTTTTSPSTSTTFRIQKKDNVVSEQGLASRIAIADGDSDAK